MKQEETLLKEYGRDSGMKVPEGYFAGLQTKIMDSLPPYKAEAPTPDLSRWQRMKPYVYLAAMFCGIWLMMQLFHMVSNPMSLSLDNPPEAIVQILDHDQEYYDYIGYPSEPDFLMEEDVMASYDSIEDFERDFNALNN